MSMSFLPPDFGRPHMVLLGAGASRAALPKGDQYGRVVPLMNDLVDILGLRPLLRDYGLDSGNSDFEALYSSLADSGNNPDLLERLEREVFQYFAALELPDRPTLYDRLVLSLRPKDVIASFNWDPLLWQSMCRIAGRFDKDILPTPVFLHGNVAVGYCMRHDPPSAGHPGAACRRCGHHLVSSRLLYPVRQKDYSKDPAIASSWEAARRTLESAYLFTVFGYRAPATDREAMRLMVEAWGNSEIHELGRTEIIDIRPQRELKENWKDFICRNHYQMAHTLHHSWLTIQPRRSCEDYWQRTMMLQLPPEHPLPINAGWGTLEAHVAPLIEQERRHEDGRE